MINIFFISKECSGGIATFLNQLDSLGAQYYRRYIFYRKVRYQKVPDRSIFLQDTYSAALEFQWKKVTIFIANVLKTRWYFHQNSADILVCCDMYSLIILSICRHFLFLRTPLVLIVNTNYSALIKLKKPAWYRAVLRSCVSFMVKNPDKVICVSQGLAHELNQRKIIVIPNGVELDNLQKKMSTPVKNIPKTAYVVSIGRFEIQKDFETVIKAFSLLHIKMPELRLLLIGSGSQKQKLSALIKNLQLSSVVTILPWQENIYPFLHQAKLLLFASLYEGFGRIIVESLAVGTPVIATNTLYGPAEILSPPYGVVVPMGDYKTMADKAGLLLRNHNLYEDYKRQGLIRADQYDLKKSVAQYRKVFVEIHG